MPPPQTVLVVDDEPSMQRYMRTLLELDSYRVEIAVNGVEALERLKKGKDPDLVFLDVLMPELDGLQTLEKMRKLKPQLKVVMLSCVSDTPKVVHSMRLGAQDYLTKPFEKHELDQVLQRCLGTPSGEMEMTCEVEELGDDLFFLAASPSMKKIASEVALVANVDIPVLMLGESGTGKEIIARLIHKRSARAHRPFSKVNCAALPGDLLESELFGYEPGAFTGANKSKPGRFEQCNKGTLMLDEVGEMPVQLQAKLLHVLQDGEFSRLGSRTSIKVDVRVLAATNIDVQKSIANKTFREDLYYRLNAFTVNVPPLRERKEEIPFLLRHYMNRMSESYGRLPIPLSPRLMEACKEAAWPGNVRELSNFVKRFLILGDEDMVLAELVRSDAEASAPVGDLKEVGRGAKNDAEAEAILRALQQTGWNKKRAATLLKISYKALLYKIQEYRIKAPAGRAAAKFQT
ncbi:MAG TPA: sigma-54 dependent transcriptional regulator [Terriglobales bacterium]|nr:sigma-54 dependent transcriptional regulator [Terriglobales bacterium]